MTAPAKTAATKATASKAVENTPNGDERIPVVLSENSILADFCKRYLGTVDEILEYNKAVLAEKDSEWNALKVLDRARKFASPENAEEVKPEIKKAVDAWESLQAEALKARKAVLDLTSRELGITLSATADRNPELEAPLKDKRKIANEIGSQLGVIAKLTSDEKASDAVNSFLTENPLPAVGREQARTFGTDENSTPKYRVKVEVFKDGNNILTADGFTKATLALTKPVFGYERGKAPKSDDLRKAWESAGNSSKETKQEVVEFDDNGLHYVLTKK